MNTYLSSKVRRGFTAAYLIGLFVSGTSVAASAAVHALMPYKAVADAYLPSLGDSKESLDVVFADLIDDRVDDVLKVLIVGR